MRKYKVYYTWYDGDAWAHEDRIDVIGAESAQEAKEKIESMTNPCDEYVVWRVEEIKDENGD